MGCTSKKIVSPGAAHVLHRYQTSVDGEAHIQWPVGVVLVVLETDEAAVHFGAYRDRVDCRNCAFGQHDFVSFPKLSGNYLLSGVRPVVLVPVYNGNTVRHVPLDISC